MTSLILNGKAVCCMHMGNFDEAETLLLEALNKVSFEVLIYFQSIFFDQILEIILHAGSNFFIQESLSHYATWLSMVSLDALLRSLFLGE